MRKPAASESPTILQSEAAALQAAPAMRAQLRSVARLRRLVDQTTAGNADRRLRLERTERLEAEERGSLKTGRDFALAQVEELKAKLRQLRRRAESAPTLPHTASTPGYAAAAQPGEAPPGLSPAARTFDDLAPEVRIVVDLRSFEDFKALRTARPEAFLEATERAVAEHALRHGTRTSFLGAVGAEHTSVGAGDLRESLVSGGLNSRMRALCDILLDELAAAGKPPEQAAIYGHEAVTHLAGLLRKRFPRYLGSEYAPDDADRRRLLPFIHNDVCDSQFPDASFDATVSCDVLEHVQDLDTALREGARTTVAGGVFLATLPFFFDMEKGSVFAQQKNGMLVHYLDEPIYHGNPMDEAGGALVFEIPGWDLLPRAMEAGFRDAVMRFVCDTEKGVTASGEGRADGPRGVFVLLARK